MQSRLGRRRKERRKSPCGDNGDLIAVVEVAKVGRRCCKIDGVGGVIDNEEMSADRPGRGTTEEKVGRGCQFTVRKTGRPAEGEADSPFALLGWRGGEFADQRAGLWNGTERWVSELAWQSKRR
jgi:hypothetical protein